MVRCAKDDQTECGHEAQEEFQQVSSSLLRKKGVLLAKIELFSFLFSDLPCVCVQPSVLLEQRR